MYRKPKLQRTIEAQIEKAAHTNVLTLSGLDLEELPRQLFALERLEVLDLSDNSFRTVPASLWEGLPHLRYVNLVSNPIHSLPNRSVVELDPLSYARVRDQVEIQNIALRIDDVDRPVSDRDWRQAVAPSNLVGLRRLLIGRMTLGGRCYEPRPATRRVLGTLRMFTALEALSICGMSLGVVPEGIRALAALRVLDLSELRLKALPEWIGELNLRSLIANNNELSTLPVTLGSRGGLEHLVLHGNTLEQIPSVVYRLKSLETLDLSACRIRHVPADILRLDSVAIDLEENPIELPPREVANRGLAAIRDYWRQRADTGVDYLCEAKLIILGEPGAGKTSLARKITNPDYALRANEASTEGIDVIRYQFPTVLHVGDGTSLQRQFHVNVWDFGGQEIYHATHQFFLTRRSMYVLVCDDRKEDTDFSYWLQIVEMLSDGSPLLIVQNEKQDRQRDIKMGTLRARFVNLRGTLSTNLQTNRGLDAIVQAIRKELESLPHVGAGLPGSWKRVREALERDPRDYIGLEEYLEVCQRHGFTRREDKLQLSGYLHDLGICLHFQEDDLLKSTIVLKPAWGTDAVYRVLDDPEVKSARGRFTREQLARIWSEPKYAGMHGELLRLMMKFQLCYELVSGRVYIAPQLLSSEQATYAWDPHGSLVLQYTYAFLPKGIVTRFIVAMNHLIPAENPVWKSGVLLERNGSRTEVVEEYEERRIRVRAVGPDARGLLAIVDDQLARLHASFPRLQCERLLPCPCSSCAGKVEPYSFPLERLANMAAKGCQIQCHASGEMVDPAALLEDILPSAVQREPRVRSELGLRKQRQRRRAPSAPDPLEVFVSYSWAPESNAIVDQLQQALQQDGIRLIRDRDEVRYKDSIREFMHRIGRGKCVVVVISKEYLESESCMFELLEISRAEALRERICPIVLANANIYRPVGRVRYVQHWEAQFRELDEELKKVRGNDLCRLQEDLNLYSDIRRMFDDIGRTLSDMNALRAEQHQESGFAEVIRRIRARTVN